MYTYLYLPNSRITIHLNDNCGFIQSHDKPNQRYIHVTTENFIEIMSNFSNRIYRFQPNREENDIWLRIDLESIKQDICFVHLIHAILSKQYKRFRDAEVSIHCDN